MPQKSHGLSRTPDGKRSYIYQAWSSMKQRCYNPADKRYPRYGGRGITVCDAWRASFEQFYKDVGDRPSSRHSLERIRNHEGYSPANCKWATKSEQALNQRSRLRVMRKTDALLLTLTPQLSSMGFSMRNIALLFNVGKTTVEKVLAGVYDSAVEIDCKLYTQERRHKESPRFRIQRTRVVP